MARKRNNPESGNAFFIVMITIVLFAALMFTFARGARQGGSDLSVKQAEITVSEILSYTQKAERGVNRVFSHEGSENVISFQNNFVSGYTNPNCPGTECRVFMPDGGSINWESAGTNASGNKPWIFSGQNAVPEIGTGSPDLVMLLPNLNGTVCANLNKTLGITGIPADGDGVETAILFTGAFAATETIGGAANSGKRSGCVSSGGTNIFYHTLLER